jgi:hypothetical protein
MTCIQCANWNLKDSAMRDAGYGLCKAMPDSIPVEQRAGRHFAAENSCRFGNFAQAPAATVTKRKKGLS